MVGLCRGWCFSCSTDKNLSRMGLGFRNKSRRGILRAMAFDEVCPEQLLDAPFDWKEPNLEVTDPRLIPPGPHGRLVTQVMDPRTLMDLQGMSVAPRTKEKSLPCPSWRV